jgi:hypothetical protein
MLGGASAATALVATLGVCCLCCGVLGVLCRGKRRPSLAQLRERRARIKAAVARRRGVKKAGNAYKVGGRARSDALREDLVS